MIRMYRVEYSWCDGFFHSELQYRSNSRKGSKKNMLDCRKALKQRNNEYATINDIMLLKGN